MGAVAEMLAKRDRRDARKRVSLWGLLWGIPVGGVFLAGTHVIPETGSRRLDALLWAGYALVWIAIAFLGENAVRRTWRLAPAKRLLLRPLGWAVFCTIMFVGYQLVPGGSTLYRGVPGAGAFFVVTMADQILARRESAPPRD